MSAVPTVGRVTAPPRSRVSQEAVDAGVLYERYYDRIYRYCLYQLGTRDEAEDAAQTTFLWAFRGLRRGVVPRAEASWLFTIAQNACRARHRARGRRREREVVSDPHLIQDLTAAPEADHEELLGLEDALARMPELQRRAILLREWRGLSYREIAAELELTGAAVETLIFRARRSLADLLAGRAAPKRTRGFALGSGSFAAAAKGLATGTGAKIAAGVAAAVLAVTIAGSEPAPTATDAPTTAQHRSRAPQSEAPLFHFTPPAAMKTPERATAKRPKTKTNTEKSKPAPAAPDSAQTDAADDGSDLGRTVEDATDPLPIVPDLVQTLPLETVTDAVDETTIDILPPPVTDALP